MPEAPANWESAVRWLREQPEFAGLVRDAYYDDPLAAAAERYRASGEWGAIRALLPQSRGAALDVGAGRGIASYALAREGFQVTALEPDPSPLVGSGAIRALARDAHVEIGVMEGFSEAVPCPDACFDLVLARAVLHHTRDLTRACGEFFRVLRPGGMLLAVREHVISAPEHLDAFLDQHPLHHMYGGEHAFMLDEYIDAIRAAGFSGPRVLTPLSSGINFAPRTAKELRHEIADRMVGGIPILRAIARTTISMPMVWTFVRPILERFDHRPGRLFSFVAVKP